MSGSECVGDTCRRHLPQFVVGAFAEQPDFFFKLIDPLVLPSNPLVLQIIPLLLLMQLLQNHFQLDTWRICGVVGHCLNCCDSPSTGTKQQAGNDEWNQCMGLSEHDSTIFDAKTLNSIVCTLVYSHNVGIIGSPYSYNQLVITVTDRTRRVPHTDERTRAFEDYGCPG